MEPKTSFEISWATLWRIVTVAAIIGIFFVAREVFGVLLVSIVISMGLEPIVSFLERHRINRILSAIAIFLVGILAFVTLVYFVIPIVSAEVVGFVEHFGQTISSFTGITLPKAALKDFSASLEDALGILSAANISISGAVGAIFGRLLLIVVTIMISFYLVVEKDGTERLLRIVLPTQYERPVLTVFNRFRAKVKNWFTAQLLLSLIVGFMVGLGLWLLGVRYYIVIGLLAAVFEIVPVIGPIITGLVAFLVAVADSLSLGVYALVFFFIVQQLENHILMPLVMGRALRVHPVVVIISLLAGAQVAGFIGVVLALPIALIAQEIFVYLADRRKERPALGL